MRPERPKSSRFLSSIIIFDYIRASKVTLIHVWGFRNEKVSEINRDEKRRPSPGKICQRIDS